MKKRKLFYLLGASTLGIALASCGSVDYKAKDFNITLPEKDSSATVVYDTNELKGDLYAAYVQRTDHRFEGNENVEEDFFKENKSIMATSVTGETTTSKDGTTEYLLEQKSIADASNGNVYYYEHQNKKMTDNNSYDVTVETNVYAKEDKYIILTDICMRDLPYALVTNTYEDEYGFEVNDSYYSKKATGNLKLTMEYVHSKPIIDGAYMLFNLATNASIAGKLAAQYTDNCIAYSNEDKSYVYSTYNSEARDENDKITSQVDSVIVKENYLNKYYTDNYHKNDYSSSYSKDYNTISKYDYFKESVLDSNYNTNGYTTFDLSTFSSKLRDNIDYHSNFPFANMPYSLNGFLVWGDILSELLTENENLTRGLTITTIEK